MEIYLLKPEPGLELKPSSFESKPKLEPSSVEARPNLEPSLFKAMETCLPKPGIRNLGPSLDPAASRSIEKG